VITGVALNVNGGMSINVAAVRRIHDPGGGGRDGRERTKPSPWAAAEATVARPTRQLRLARAILSAHRADIPFLVTVFLY
jgi:hypothetical protein